MLTHSEICNLVQKLIYICFEHIRLIVEDIRIPNRPVKWSYPQISSPRVMLICWGNVENTDDEFLLLFITFILYEHSLKMHHIRQC